MTLSAQFACEPDARFLFSHAANLAILPGGRLALVCFRGSIEGAADTVATFQVLGEDGRWSDPRVVVDEPGRAVGNSVLMPVPDGRVLLFYTVSGSIDDNAMWSGCSICYIASEDRGATWSGCSVLTEETGFICRNPGLVLGNGDWLLPIYDNRGGALEAYEGMGGNESSVLISSDQGRHWRRYGRMVAGAGTVQPSVVECGDGRLVALLRTRNFWNGSDPRWAYIYRSESRDHGRNWTHPRATALPNNNSSLQALRLAGGALALAYNHQSSAERSPLNISLSYDDGDSWPVMRELEAYDAEGSYCYPALAQTADGRIHVAYTYNETHIKHVVMTQDWIEGRQA